VLSYIPSILFIALIIHVLDIGKQVGFRKQNIGTGLVLGLLVIPLGAAFDFVTGLVNIGALDFTLVKSPGVIYYTLSMFLIGAHEELLCRGVLLNIMKNKWGHTKKGLVKSVVWSSAFFGLIHLVNLINLLAYPNPALVYSTIAQVVYATIIGAFLACVYLRCENIWTVIILHGLIDWFCFIFGSFKPDSVTRVVSGNPMLEALISVLVTLPLAFAGMFLLRKVKNLYS
jgi:membrane protease YdiL (CAAX protease family)